jgi:hypothetical protein
MPILIDDEDVPDMLRSWRALIAVEEKTAVKAREEKASYAPQLEGGVMKLKAKLAKYEKRDRERKN